MTFIHVGRTCWKTIINKIINKEMTNGFHKVNEKYNYIQSLTQKRLDAKKKKKKNKFSAVY